MELAGDRLTGSLTSGAKAEEVIEMLVTFLAIQNLDPSEENETFEINLSVAGKIDRATIANSFNNKQTRRDTANRAKEAGLAARTSQPPSKGNQRPPANRPVCSHCEEESHDVVQQAYPDNMPPWMKIHNEEQLKSHGQQKAASKASAGANVAVSEEPEDNDNEEEAESVMMAKPKPASNSSTMAKAYHPQLPLTM
ncbi:hypothetical protein FRC01_009667 [Tulasnella sp. 417]|nr:hypothetical protein FRC01_009667 [Tulasnella sp. 417]